MVRGAQIAAQKLMSCKALAEATKTADSNEADFLWLDCCHDMPHMSMASRRTCSSGITEIHVPDVSLVDTSHPCTRSSIVLYLC